MSRATENLRFALAAALLLGTAVFLQARHKAEIVPRSEPLSSFPTAVGNWQGRRLAISDSVREVLGPGDFLSRVYTRPDRPYVDLFVAYFPSQQAGDTIHSPKNCLPGSGWTPMKAERLQITVPGRPRILANRYIIAKGAERQLVLYWYQAHGRTVASEYWAKIYLVLDALRMNRTDGSLVRVLTPITQNETEAAAEQRVVDFASLAAPPLDNYIPR
jgi:EpsI family protein